LVEDGPDFEALAELPAAAVEHRAAAAELRRLALVARALREVVEVLLGGHLQPDGFELLFHDFKSPESGVASLESTRLKLLSSTPDSRLTWTPASSAQASPFAPRRAGRACG